MSAISQQVGTHVFVKVTSCSVYDNMLKIIIDEQKYKYEQSVGSVITGETPPVAPIEDRFAEVIVGVNAGNDSWSIQKKNEIIIFDELMKERKIYSIPNSNFVWFRTSEGGFVQYHVYDTLLHNEINSLFNDRRFWWMVSPDKSFVYRVCGGNFFYNEFATAKEYSLPWYSYEFVSNNIENIKIISLKNKIVVNVGDRKVLYDLISGEKICDLNIPDIETIYDVSLINDKIVVLSSFGNGIFLREINGKLVSKVNSDMLRTSLSNYAWDYVNNKVYFVDIFNSPQQKKGSELKILVWDYGLGTAHDYSLKYK